MLETFHYIIAAAVSILLSLVNTWYWNQNGYSKGKLFVVGTVSFFALILLVLKNLKENGLF